MPNKEIIEHNVPNGSVNNEELDKESRLYLDRKREDLMQEFRSLTENLSDEELNKVEMALFELKDKLK